MYDADKKGLGHMTICLTVTKQASGLNPDFDTYHLNGQNFNCFRKEVKLVLLNNSFYILQEVYKPKSVR
jgi:hypothetical protein